MEPNPTRQAIQDAMILRGYNQYTDAQWRVIEAEIKLRRILPHHAREAVDVWASEVKRRPTPIELVNLLKRRPWEAPASQVDDSGPGPFSMEVYAQFQKLPESLQHDMLTSATSDQNLRERAERDVELYPRGTVEDRMRWMRQGMGLYPWMQKVTAAFLAQAMREAGTLTDELIEAHRQEDEDVPEPLGEWI